MRRDDLELRIRTVAGLLVGAPSSKLSRVAESVPLHVVVSNLDNEFRPERLPGQILALTPAAQATRHTHGVLFRIRPGPILPGMVAQSIAPILAQMLHKLTPLRLGEAGADADMMKAARFIEETKEKRPNRLALAILVPSES